MATEELRAFLVSARTKLQRYISPDGNLKSNDDSTTDDPEKLSKPEYVSLLVKRSTDSIEGQERQLQETAKLVDTTLFRSYMFASPSLAGPLFRIDNFCDPDVVKDKLVETGRYNDLVDFFYGKKLHRPALELLKKCGQQDEEDKTTSQLAGPQRTVTYLQNLPPELIDVILEFAEWPLRKNADLGMEVFLADTENAEKLPRANVIDFLQDIDRKLAMTYLEHIIHGLDDTTPDFHQKLVSIYVEGLKLNDFGEEMERQVWREKTLDFLRTSKHYQPYKILRQLSAEGTRIFSRSNQYIELT